MMRMTCGISPAFWRVSTYDWYFANDFSEAYTLNLFIFFSANHSPSGEDSIPYEDLRRALKTVPQVPVPSTSDGEYV
jgi:hypothetical protein